MTITRKHPRSAAATARVISRILKQDGFKRSDQKSKFYWTEGFLVLRVGRSNSVHVDYHIPELKDESKRAERRSKIAQMRETLFELGYVSSHPHLIYIECRES